MTYSCVKMTEGDQGSQYLESPHGTQVGPVSVGERDVLAFLSDAIDKIVAAYTLSDLYDPLEEAEFLVRKLKELGVIIPD